MNQGPGSFFLPYKPGAACKRTVLSTGVLTSTLSGLIIIRGQGIFFRDPMNTAVLLNGNGRLPLS
jgi:hypothetical protein